MPLHTPETKIASIDKQLARVRYKPHYDEDEVTPDELLDRRLALMMERDLDGPDRDAA
jgi:hypothetical protein